jgi:hypothetical protein
MWTENILLVSDKETVIHSLTANIGQFRSIVKTFFISFFEGRMFSRWIVTNITSARGTLHCRKTHSLRGSARGLWTVVTEQA